MPVSPLVAPAALVSPANAESSAWYCTGQTTSAGGTPGFVLLTNTMDRPVAATVSESTDGGSVENAAVSVPAHGDVIPTVPAPTSGTWLSAIVTVAGGGVAVCQVVAGATGWSSLAVPEHHVGSLVLRRRVHHGFERAVRFAVQPDLDTRRGRSQLRHRRTASSIPINFQGIVLQPDQTRWRTSAPYVQNQATVSTTVSARTGRMVAVRGTAARRDRPSGLALVPGSPPTAKSGSSPRVQEVAGGSSAIDVFNPGPTAER